MPTTLIDSSSFDAMTAPIGTDIRNAASVRTCLQAAANRDRFVYDIVTPLADIAALKAISAPADGTVRSVVAHGAYVFLSSYVGAESLPWVVAPSIGAGRWVSMSVGLLDYEGGVERHHAPLADVASLKAVTGQKPGDTRLVVGNGIYVFSSLSQPERLPYLVKPTVGLGSWNLAQERAKWRLGGTDSIGMSEWTTSMVWVDIAARHFPSIEMNDRFVIDVFAECGVVPSAEGEIRCIMDAPMGTTEIGSIYFDADKLFVCAYASEMVDPDEEGAYSVRVQLKKNDLGPASVGVRRGSLRIQLFEI